jgi:hypothetical protein
MFTNKTDIRLGFEIECIVKEGCRGKLCNEIRALKKGITIGDDGSLEPDDDYDGTTAEIRTKPLPPKDAMETLKTLFDIVNKYGGTNESCGFHVNISSLHKRKMRNFDPIPFLSSSLWNEILSKFNLRSNEFCQPTFCGFNRQRFSKVGLLRRLADTEIFDEKYNCVNFCNFGNGTGKSSRVEIRGFGNKDYTKKFDVIAFFVKRIERLFNLSCNNALILTRTFNV